MNKTFLFSISVLICFSISVFANNDHSNPPHSTGEIVWDIGIGVASAAAGGVAAAGGNVPGAVLGMANGAKKICWSGKKI